MLNIITNMLFVLFMCSHLSGCAISNEGATDYRFYRGDVSRKYIKPKDSKSPIDIGQPLVVTIKQAYINDFSEFRSPLRVARFEPPNGEIAIVVNAFEKGKNNLNFGKSGYENARVVFFSDDVWEGQFLNLSNISTVYGPLKYEGNPFILDLYVIEFDMPGEQLKQIISNVVKMGSTFYPPAAPIAGALGQIASSFITDEQDDRAYHHTMELRPLGGDMDLESGLLQTGHYAFIRESDRYGTTPWSELSIDGNTGRIIYKNLEEQQGEAVVKICQADDENVELPEQCFYKENTYIVLEFNTAASSLANDMQQMLYKDLVADISAKAAPIATTATAEDALDQLSKGLSNLRSFDALRPLIKTLEDKNTPLFENNFSVENFLSYWYEKDLKTGDVKYSLNDNDTKQIIKRVGLLISSCESDQNKILSLMSVIRNRSIIPTLTDKSNLFTALSCQHKA